MMSGTEKIRRFEIETSFSNIIKYEIFIEIKNNKNCKFTK